jgi:hypothetical protein
MINGAKRRKSTLNIYLGMKNKKHIMVGVVGENNPNGM